MAVGKTPCSTRTHHLSGDRGPFHHIQKKPARLALDTSPSAARRVTGQPAGRCMF
ncbi:hypothetical protein TGAMA5MH_03045 [Trichoderma gamsii]|uniref:Uncharacterized protein n=1 Tax=Trichoderma gamsii TaxID=398673 RepID=A0A2K0TIF9_9HYPO|nr:hypothetical protein TGAMA5MH_03045 [Trichoderma gamsii]